MVWRAFGFSMLALPVGCDANLRIRTSHAPLQESFAEAIDPSNLEFVLETHDLTTSLDDIEAVWSFSDGQNHNLVYQVHLASSATCLDAVMKVEVKNQPQAVLSGLQEGTYFLCVKANVNGVDIVATNNGVKIVIDRTAPAIAALPDLDRNGVTMLDPTVTDMSALTYRWEQVSGPGTMSFSDPLAHATNASFTAEGAYRLRFNAKDAAGNTSFKEFDVRYDVTAPVVNAGADLCGYANLPSNIDATVTGATSYSWAKTAGPGSCSFGAPTSVDTTATCTTTGNVTLTLTATDDVGNSASDSLALTLHPGGTGGTKNLCYGVKFADFSANADFGMAVAVQPDGKIVLAGSAYNGTVYQPAFARFNADGTVDTSFGTNGQLVVNMNGDIQDMKLQNDGKIVGVGSSDDNLLLIRVTTSGVLDTTFSGDGIATHDIAERIFGGSVAIQSDGKIVVGAQWETTDFDFGIARYTTAGVLDTTFNTTGYVTLDYGDNDSVYDLKIQADGKIVAAGYSSIGANHDFLVTRLTDTGAVDATFGGGTAVRIAIGTGDDIGHGLALQTDGKIIVVGDYANGATRDLAVARLNTDGTFDTTFDGDGKAMIPTSNNSEHRQRVAVQSDGKIVIVSTLTNGTDFDMLLVRLNTNGSLDTSFDGDGKAVLDLGGFEDGYHVAFDSNEDIVVAGNTSVTGGGAMVLLKVYK